MVFRSGRGSSGVAAPNFAGRQFNWKNDEFSSEEARAIAGMHVVGDGPDASIVLSDGTSLVSLPQQNPHALYFKDEKIDPREVIDELHTGTPRPVQPGRCGSFDGADDYINIGLIGDIASVSDYTISLWIHSTNVTTIQCPISVCNGGSGTNEQALILMNYPVAGQLTFRVSGTQQSIGGGVPSGVWKHVAIKYTGTTVVGYIDGVQVASFTASKPTAASSRCLIGCNNNGSVPTAGQYFNGKLFDVRIYNRALAASEIASIFTSSKPGGSPDKFLFPANLIGHWKLDDGRVDIARDSSGNGYHGVPTGVALGTFNANSNDVPFSFENEVGYGETITNLIGAHDALDQGTDVITSLGGGRYSLTVAAVGSRFGRFRFPLALIQNKMIDYEVFIESITSGTVSVDFSDAFFDTAVGAGSTIQKNGVTRAGGYDSTYRIFDINMFGQSAGATVVFQIKKLQARDVIPQKSSIPSTDALGNPLQYTGNVPRNAKMIDSFCGTFDGLDDYAAAVGGHPSINSSFTLSAWVKWTGTANQAILGRYNNGTGYMIYIGPSGSLSVYSGSSGVPGYAQTAVSAVAANTWVHVAGTWNGSSVALFINGSPVASTPGGTLTNPGDAGVYFALSGYAGGGSGRFAGSILDARVYDAALSPADILAVFQGKDIVSQPVGHWPIQEGDGTTLHDVSGNGNHAILIGATLGTFWGTRQSQVHRNIRKGFSQIGTVKVPARNDGALSAIGSPVTSPAGSWHNGAETKLDMTGAVAAPWTSRIRDGYYTVSNDGISILPAVQAVTGDFSVFGRVRPTLKVGGATQYLFDSVRSGGRCLLQIQSTTNKVALFDGTTTFEFGECVWGEWNNILFVFKSGRMGCWINGKFTTWVTPAAPTLSASTAARLGSINSGGTTGSLLGDIERFRLVNGAFELDSVLAEPALLDIHFDEPTLRDAASNYALTVPGTWTLKTGSVPATYAFGDALPHLWSKVVKDQHEEQFACPAM